MANGTKLDQDKVKDALARLSWPDLRAHLVETGLDAPVLDALLGHVRRCNELVIKRPDARRTERRRAFFESFLNHLAEQAGAAAEARLRAVVAHFELVDRGFHEILRRRAACPGANLPAEKRVTAALVLAAAGFQEVSRRMEEDLRKRAEVSLASARLDLGGGVTASPDGFITALVEICTMILLMESHLGGWFDADKTVVLPPLSEVAEEDLRSVGEINWLATSWSRWERMDQSSRFLDREITIGTGKDIPEWAPAETSTFIRCAGPGRTEMLDFVANERLRKRLVLTFAEMTFKTDLSQKAAGISAPVALWPGGFVSSEEAHACVMLSESLGYAIAEDGETPGGLRLVEWLRGYAALQCLVRDVAAEGGPAKLLLPIAREDLMAFLREMGLEGKSAETFVERLSLNASSRDLFDQPLIRVQDGSLLIFGPGLVTANPAQVTLSVLGNLGVQFGKKGEAFERTVLRFFNERKLPAIGFNMTWNGETYQYDAIVPWGEFVFVFECKNRSLSGHNPIQAYYGALEQRSAVRQVRRLVEGLRANPGPLMERKGIDLTGKTIVPCVLNALPYSAAGGDDGVYVTDMSALSRFFKERYFNVVQPHVKKGQPKALHRTALASLWAGDEPTPQDLLRHLSDPLQISIAKAHITTGPLRFGLGEETVVEVEEIAQEEESLEKMASLFGADATALRRGIKGFGKLLSKVGKSSERKKRSAEEKLVRTRDRAWRARQARNGGAPAR